jgi:hypothetical protein
MLKGLFKREPPPLKGILTPQKSKRDGHHVTPLRVGSSVKKRVQLGEKALTPVSVHEIPWENQA